MRRLLLTGSVPGLWVLAAGTVSTGQAPRPAVQRCDVSLTVQPDRSAIVVAIMSTVASIMIVTGSVLAQYPINVSSVSPGLIDVGVRPGVSREYKEALIRTIPWGRMGQPGDSRSARRHPRSGEGRRP